MAISFSSVGQVYFEDFTGEADNATTGTAVGGTWSTTLPSGGAASFSRLNVGAPYGGIFRVDNTGTEGVWRSNVLDISTLGEVALEVLMGGVGTNNNDYIRAYYRINGGAEVLFAEVLGDADLVVFTASSAVVSGTNLQIVIRGFDDSGGGGLMGFDDVRVTDISVLYSRASNNWSVPATWSSTGFTGGACGCTPNEDTRVIIGNGRNVSLNADGTAAGIEIQSGSTLTWTANNADLTIERGGTVNIQSGGTATRGTATGSTIQFANYANSLSNAGSVDIGSVIFNGGNGSIINNSGSFTLGVLDLNTNNITFNNSGTVDMNGNFTDVDAGSAFNNLSGGSWNFSGTTITGVRLFANNNGNTFNYDGAAQNIITPQDAYWHLSLSGSGAKTAQGNFSVRGNWTRTGTATFAPSTFRVSLTGNAAQTIAATGGETFANLTINNSFATSPQIVLSNPVTVSTNLTMTDGNINLNGNAFTLSGTLTHDQNPASGWMYGASITRAITSAIAVGNVAGYFPLGTSTDSRPFLISKDNPANSNGTLTVRYTDATTATNVSFMDGAASVQRRHDSYWTLTKTSMTTGTYQISAGGTGFTIGNVNQTRLTRINNATAIGTAAASSGTATDVRVHRTGLTAAQLLNDFYLASTNSSASSLPIVLAWFRARIEGDEVIASWETAQEKNNHFFTIEKTVDFEKFYQVGRVNGQGNSAEITAYSFVDTTPFSGRTYYRLKQTDYDGKFSYSDPVMIDYSGPESPFVKTYPNPAEGGSVTLEVKGLDGIQEIPVSIFNQQGEKVMSLVMNEEGPGVFRKKIMFDLAPGIYVVKAGRTLKLTSKLVVK